ncbi:MAG TPA: hypothetical protein VGN19_12585, partial [Pedococcus sp.]|nr:hypothetical protein [Pedococcus sp.]
MYSFKIEHNHTHSGAGAHVSADSASGLPAGASTGGGPKVRAMKGVQHRRGLLVAVLVAALTSMSSLTSAHAGPSAPAVFSGQARSLVNAVVVACAGRASCALASVSEEMIAAGVQETTAVLRVGSGAHDLIGLHRVVAVDAAGRPLAGRRAVMLLHGDVWGFDAAFAGQLGTGTR